MTVRELLDICDDIFKIELCCEVKMYGKEDYVMIAYKTKGEILKMLDENVDGMGEIAAKEVKRLSWHVLTDSAISIAF